MSISALSPVFTMNDGHSIPQLGLGVYKVDDDVAASTVEAALTLGYRRVDTAALYGNEVGTGRGIRSSGLPRDEVFVTTKVWDDDHGYEATLAAFETSRRKLGLDYVDLYLIHWPVPSKDLYRETWRALEKLREAGVARSIGVSNFSTSHLERLAESADVTPAINQVEMHPWLPQNDLRAWDAAHGVLTEAWSPLARGRLVGEPLLDELATEHGRSPAQIVLRWHVQRGGLVIPKSVTPSRIADNIAVFDFELSDDDMARIATLESGERTGMDPDDH